MKPEKPEKPEEPAFPDAEGKKCRRIRIQIIMGLLLTLISITGIMLYRCREAEQRRRFQQIKGAENILPEIPAETSTKISAEIPEEMPEEKEGESMGENPQEIDEGNHAGMAETDKNTVIFAYDWDSLVEANADIKGWLYIPDTPVDLPVVGASDNDYYLNHDFWKKEKSTGCPFMDKDTDQWDFNRTIYAHNMSRASDAMFSPLLHYKDEEYFTTHRKLYYTECYGDTAEYQIIAVVKYNAGDTRSWDFRTRNHADREDYSLWMGQLRKRALYYEEPDSDSEKLLTLSTCDRSEFGKDGRLIVVAGKCGQ